MASGKQQNLLVPMIVSAVLFVVMGVTAFLFYQKTTKLNTELQTAKKSAEDATRNKGIADNNIKLLKTLIGYPDAELGTEADQQGGTSLISKIREDLAKFADPNTPPAFSYKDELGRLALKRDDLTKELTTQRESYTQLQALFDSTRKAEELKINENVTNFQQAEARRENLQTEVNRQLEEANRQIQTRQEQVQQEALNKKQVETDFENYQKKSETTITSLRTQVSSFKETFTRLQSSGTPVASVISVDNLNNEVYIDRGESHLLPLQTTFSIWAPDKTASIHWKDKNEKIRGDAKKEYEDSGKRNALEPRLEGGPKAYIEIVQILGPNEAKGRITMEKSLDPIAPGDLLFSPMWEPGLQKHFALVGRFDMSGKGTDDRALLVSMIKRQGGIVDVEVQNDGSIPPGQGINPRTDWLVIGTMPDETDNTDPQQNVAGLIHKAREELMREAKSFGVEIIDQEKLYDFMGYKRHSNKYEPGAYTGASTPSNPFENPANSTRPSGLPSFESGASSRSDSIPGTSVGGRRK